MILANVIKALEEEENGYDDTNMNPSTSYNQRENRDFKKGGRGSVLRINLTRFLMIDGKEDPLRSFKSSERCIWIG